ncbi:DUF4393 domain-containing protein [Brevibacterium luteolum]|uniref:DUF4393 domain-containing protein n=1 Tax=Brevibacterium luteolum TaxID=199591 RepID=UPI001C223003|nr:DUF4393 domain-containing protein [Brevibacterium luteolum]MBU8578294.1 DUF4393 domain-containing protein [Brevibacterium luteolum]
MSATNALMKLIDNMSPEERGLLIRHAISLGAHDPALMEKGRRSALSERTKSWPLAILVKYLDPKYYTYINKRLGLIPDEQLVDPDPNVAEPAIEGIARNVDNSELRDMYVELLAQASQDSTKRNALPAFASIIGDLSPDEALLLKTILPLNQIPIAQMRIEETPAEISWSGPGPQIAYHIERPYLVSLKNSEGDFISSHEFDLYLNNWERLKLIEVSFSRHYSNVDDYAYAEEHTRFKELSANLSGSSTQKLVTIHGVLDVTPFGRGFARTVIGDDHLSAVPNL